MARNNGKKTLLANMTIQEASDFWDEHSLLEFDDTEEVAVKFNLKKKQYIGIDREVFKKLAAQAKRKKLSVDALLENWIVEKVH